jgi:hypothetical protein
MREVISLDPSCAINYADYEVSWYSSVLIDICQGSSFNQATSFPIHYSQSSNSQFLH